MRLQFVLVHIRYQNVKTNLYIVSVCPVTPTSSCKMCECKKWVQAVIQCCSFWEMGLPSCNLSAPLQLFFHCICRHFHGEHGSYQLQSALFSSSSVHSTDTYVWWLPVIFLALFAQLFPGCCCPWQHTATNLSPPCQWKESTAISTAFCDVVHSSM